MPWAFILPLVNAGSRKAANRAMIAITTSNSIKVNALRRFGRSIFTVMAYGIGCRSVVLMNPPTVEVGGLVFIASMVGLCQDIAIPN